MIRAERSDDCAPHPSQHKNCRTLTDFSPSGTSTVVIGEPPNRYIMKKMLKIKSYLVSGFFLSFLFLFPACQQESNSLPDQHDESDILTNAGELHNRMIAYYYSHRSVKDPSWEGIFKELLDLSSEYLVNMGYDFASIGETRMKLERDLGPSFLKSTSDRGFSLDPATFISQLTSTGLYSGRFVGEIDKILKLARKKDDKKVIRQYVNTEFSGVKFQEEKDREAQQLFISVFNGSYEYWESYYQSHLKGALLKDSSWVIINDGIGGILGSIFGPLGSIICATVFSVGTNEELQS